MLLAAGGVLWTINLLYNRPLFMDEANVVRNLYDRSYANLSTPLDHEQYAPPLYLLWTKILGELFGYREWVLRIPAFLGGLLAVYGMWKISKKILNEYWSLLPLAFLFGNPIVLRYVTEVKPYGLDLGISALLLALHLRTRPLSPVAWLVVGVFCPWFSLPSVFVLAAIGLRGLRYDRRYLLPILGWLASFALLYVQVLRPSVGSDYLNDFHRDYFIPAVLDGEGLARLGRITRRLLRLSFGVTWVAIVWGGVLIVTGLLLRPRLLWLLLPLLIVVAASSLRLYSLMDRLMLFVLPGVWLFAAATAQRLAGLARSKGLRGLVVGLCLLTAGGGNIWHRYWTPERTGDGRRLAALAAQPDVYLDLSAVPVVDYYARIHPHTRFTAVPLEASSPPAGAVRYTVLFDVTTERTILEQAKKVEERAAARGCNVLVEELFRARGVQVRCRAPNSDP